jgi:hypothetical protein
VVSRRADACCKESITSLKSAHHGPCFPGACLAVSENRAAVPLQGVCNQRFGGVLVDILLAHILSKHTIEVEILPEGRNNGSTL